MESRTPGQKQNFEPKTIINPKKDINFRGTRKPSGGESKAEERERGLKAHSTRWKKEKKKKV